MTVNKKIDLLRGKLREGKVYRRQDLMQWTNSIDRHLAQLTDEGVLRKLASGYLLCPQTFRRSNMEMEKVMDRMNKDDVWILPVLDEQNKYLGFVSKSSVFNKYRALLMRQANYLT